MHTTFLNFSTKEIGSLPYSNLLYLVNKGSVFEAMSSDILCKILPADPINIVIMKIGKNRRYQTDHHQE